MPSVEPVNLKNPILAAVLAWLVPGLGHLYQGRITKGILFAVCILGLFFFGFQQGGWRNVYFRWDKEEWRWPYLAQVGAGLVALPALIHKPAWRANFPPSIATYQARPYTEDELNSLARKHDLRLITQEDKEEALRERHRIALVSEREMDDMHRKLGKRMDIAVVYTMIAGVLNILVIYDALAGPALAEEEARLLSGKTSHSGEAGLAQ